MSQTEKTKEYRIGLNDALSIFMLPNTANIVFENAGEMLGAGGGAMRATQSSFTSTVEFDGTIKFPILGRIYVNNLTIRELELLLEENFKKYFNDPFVTVNVTNRRVLVFPGGAGRAQVVPLPYQNTSLLEVLATIGGIPASGKAEKIILIRDNGSINQKIYKLDLSQLSSLNQTSFIIQANDIIYVEPRNEYFLNFIERIAPYIAGINVLLLTSRFFITF